MAVSGWKIVHRITRNNLYMSVLVARYCSPCLPRLYVCPCRMLLRSLSTEPISLSLSHAVALLVCRAYICLSLSHAIALLVYHAHVSVLVAHCCSLCLSCLYVCPCRTLVLSLSTDARQGKQQCATRTAFDLLKKKFSFWHTRFSRTKHTERKRGA